MHFWLWKNQAPLSLEVWRVILVTFCSTTSLFLLYQQQGMKRCIKHILDPELSTSVLKHKWHSYKRRRAGDDWGIHLCCSLWSLITQVRFNINKLCLPNSLSSSALSICCYRTFWPIYLIFKRSFASTIYRHLKYTSAVLKKLLPYLSIRK